MIAKKDTTPTDKICPIMSVKMIQWGNVFVECRKECALYELCNPPSVIPKAQTKTQNSNLTFEKVIEEIQTQVIQLPDTHQEFVFTRKIETDGDSIKICGWEYKGVKDGERVEQ